MIQPQQSPQKVERSRQKPRTSFQSRAKQVSTNLSTSNQLQQYFSFKLREAVVPEDPTIGWTYNVPIISPNQKSIYLATQIFTAVILDYVGDNFPQTIAISIKNFSGFVEKDGTNSSKIIILNLFSVSSNITQQGIQYRDLIYKNEMSAMWQLGSLRNLQFQVYLDDQTTPMNFPITNPINVTFKILHLAV